MQSDTRLNSLYGRFNCNNDEPLDRLEHNLKQPLRSFLKRRLLSDRSWNERQNWCAAAVLASTVIAHKIKNGFILPVLKRDLLITHEITPIFEQRTGYSCLLQGQCSPELRAGDTTGSAKHSRSRANNTSKCRGVHIDCVVSFLRQPFYSLCLTFSCRNSILLNSRQTTTTTTLNDWLLAHLMRVFSK